MDDNLLDRAIDDVVRDLVAGDPGPAFRERVIDRLRERRASWLSPWMFAPMAATALLVIAIVVHLTPGQRKSSTTSGGGPDLLPASATAVAGSLFGQDPAGMRSPPAARGVVAAPAGESAVASLAPHRLEVTSLTLQEIDRGVSLHIPELEPIVPIAVAPIGEPQGEPR